MHVGIFCLKTLIYIVNNLYIGPIVPQAVSEYQLGWKYKTLKKFVIQVYYIKNVFKFYLGNLSKLKITLVSQLTCKKSLISGIFDIHKLFNAILNHCNN